MQHANTYLRASLAAATIAGIAAGSVAFAIPALADVTGYQTGYSYHEGLANGDGAMLMMAGNQGDAVSSADTSTAAPVSTAPAQPVSVITNESAAPAVAPAAETAQPAAAATNGSFFASISPVTWGAIALLVLAFLVIVAMLAREPEEVRRTERVYHRYS